METITRRNNQPALSELGEQTLAQYEQQLRVEEDLATERGLGYLIQKYADRAHVSDLSPHDLRHRFGYRMAKTVPLHRLAQLMGHDSLDTTMLYVQGTRDDLQRAVETIAWT